MNADRILALSIRISQGKPVRIPALTPRELAILLNHVAANREEIHGPQLPTTH